jgi:fatty acyl-CoA reductase
VLTRISNAQAFSGREVLITGTTGFVGSVLLAKMLRGIPSLKTAYVMVRSSKTQTAAQRMSVCLMSTGPAPQ